VGRSGTTTGTGSTESLPRRTSAALRRQGSRLGHSNPAGRNLAGEAADGAALMTETEVEFEIDKACSNIVPNMTLATAMHENLTRIGPVPFDAKDVAFADQIRATLTPDDVAHSIEMYGTPEAASAMLYGAPVPLDPTPRHLGGSTDVGDVSWIVPTVQMWGACFAVGTPGHSWQLVAHQSQIPGPGDFLGVDLGVERVLVVRGAAGAQKASGR